VPNKPNSPGPAAQNKPNSRSAGYPQDSTMLSFHHSNSIPIAPNEANFARRPGTRETETCKTNPIRLIKSAKRTQFSASRTAGTGQLRQTNPISATRLPERQSYQTNPILGSRRPIVQNEATCPKRGTEAVSRQGRARRALGDKGVLYKQTQFGVPSREEGCRCEQTKPNLGELGHLGADAEGLVKQTQFGGTPAAACRLGLVRAVCTNKPNSGGSRRGAPYKQTQFRWVATGRAVQTNPIRAGEGEAGAAAGGRCETKPIPGRSAGTSGPVVQTKPIRRVDRATSPRCAASGNKANFHRSG
jgi:hypothetical protein